ncbi:MAG: hypothetical protein WA005_19740 [Candidatus Binataceae bacterium]
MMAPRKGSKRKRGSPGSIIRKVRKPIAPPVRIEQSVTRYRRQRERERMRREEEEKET